MDFLEQSQTDQGLSLFFFCNFGILTLYILASTIQQIENRPTVAVRRLDSPKLHTTTYLQVMRNLMSSARYKLQIQYP